MKRKVLAKSSMPATRSTSLTALAGKHHKHYCTNGGCRLAYEDNCEEPEVNGECSLCRGWRRSIYDMWLDPQECCIDNTYQVLNRGELLRFRLGGPGPWYQCRTCFRHHPYPC